MKDHCRIIQSLLLIETGMKLDLPKSSATEDSSSVWGGGNNVPARMLMRRGGGALPLPVFATNANSPRNSPGKNVWFELVQSGLGWF